MENNDKQNDGKTCGCKTGSKCCCMEIGKKLCAGCSCFKNFLLKLFKR